MSTILSGALVMACAVIGLCFLRFWKTSRDRLFLWFAVAFWLQGVQWLHSALHAHLTDYSPIYYVMRLAAYALIAAAIVQKNLRRPSA